MKGIEVRTDIALSEEQKDVWIYQLHRAGSISAEGAVFENLGKGKYQFIVGQYENGDSMYDGQLICQYYANGKISDMDNHTYTCPKYSEGQSKTEQEAFPDIQRGNFISRMQDEKLAELTVQDVEMAYEIDSKGFWQPVYIF